MKAKHIAFAGLGVVVIVALIALWRASRPQEESATPTPAAADSDSTSARQPATRSDKRPEISTDTDDSITATARTHVRGDGTQVRDHRPNPGVGKTEAPDREAPKTSVPGVRMQNTHVIGMRRAGQEVLDQCRSKLGRSPSKDKSAGKMEARVYINIKDEKLAVESVNLKAGSLDGSDPLMKCTQKGLEKMALATKGQANMNHYRVIMRFRM